MKKCSLNLSDFLIINHTFQNVQSTQNVFYNTWTIINQCTLNIHRSQGYPNKSWGHIHNQSATKISMVNKAHPALKRTKKTKPPLHTKGPDVIHTLNTLHNGVQKCHWIQWPGVIKSPCKGMFSGGFLTHRCHISHTNLTSTMANFYINSMQG